MKRKSRNKGRYPSLKKLEKGGAEILSAVDEVVLTAGFSWKSIWRLGGHGEQMADAEI